MLDYFNKSCFFKSIIVKLKNSAKDSLFIIREIRLNRHIITRYINLDIHVLNYYNVDNKLIKALFKYIIFVINNLKAKILININILIYENIDLIIFTRIDYTNNCYISFNFNIILSIRFFIK